MKAVKTKLVLYADHHHHADRQAQRKSKDVNERKQFMFQQIPKCNFKIGPEHDDNIYKSTRQPDQNYPTKCQIAILLNINLIPTIEHVNCTVLIQVVYGFG